MRTDVIHYTPCCTTLTGRDSPTLLGLHRGKPNVYDMWVNEEIRRGSGKQFKSWRFCPCNCLKNCSYSSRSISLVRLFWPSVSYVYEFNTWKKSEYLLFYAFFLISAQNSRESKHGKLETWLSNVAQPGQNLAPKGWANRTEWGSICLTFSIHICHDLQLSSWFLLVAIFLLIVYGAV